MFHELKFDGKLFHDGSETKMYKVAFIGVSGSGKTTIINQYINNTFVKDFIPTTNAM